MFMFMFIFIFLLLLFAVFLFIKNENTYKKRIIIINAISAYYYDSISKKKYDYKKYVIYDDMEPSGKTLMRLYDFGYTRILPKEKYEIIKPYIKKEG